MIVLPLIYFFVFILIIYKLGIFDITYLSKKQYVLFFSIKVIAGIILYLIYTRHYSYRDTSDALRFFDDAFVVYRDFSKNPLLYFKIMLGIDCNGPEYQHYYELMNNWTKQYDYGLFNDNRTIIRANMFMLLFSFGNYHVHTVFINFISFIGLVLLLKFLNQKSGINSLVLAFIIFLTPSLLFWGSGVLKEGVLLLSLGGCCYAFQKLNQNAIKGLLLLFCFSFLLIISKLYIFMAIVPGFLALYISEKVKSLKPITLFLIVHLVGFIFLVYGGKTLIHYDFLSTLSAKQADFINVAQIWSANSTIEITPINNSVTNLLLSLPQALINSLFRPLFFDSKNLMMHLCSLENGLIIMLILTSLFYCNKKKMNPIIAFSLFFTVTLGALIGWVTPILGAIVRYKIPLMPFLILIPTYYIDSDKLPQQIKNIITSITVNLIKWTK